MKQFIILQITGIILIFAGLFGVLSPWMLSIESLTVHYVVCYFTGVAGLFIYVLSLVHIHKTTEKIRSDYYDEAECHFQTKWKYFHDRIKYVDAGINLMKTKRQLKSERNKATAYKLNYYKLKKKYDKLKKGGRK